MTKNKFKIAATNTFFKNVKKRYGDSLNNTIKEKLYPVLEKEPKYGPKIKRLHGNLGLIYRYKTGGVKIFYFLDEEKDIVYLLDLIKKEI